MFLPFIRAFCNLINSLLALKEVFYFILIHIRFSAQASEQISKIVLVFTNQTGALQTFPSCQCYLMEGCLRKFCDNGKSEERKWKS